MHGAKMKVKSLFLWTAGPLNMGAIGFPETCCGKSLKTADHFFTVCGRLIVSLFACIVTALKSLKKKRFVYD